MTASTGRKVYTAPVLETLDMTETHDIGIGIGLGIGLGIGGLGS